MIAFSNVHKSFGDTSVLNGLSFAVNEGEIYGLLGPNGAGKTTAINILCNLLDADSGTVTICHERVSERTKVHVGVVPQEISLYRDLTCRENLRFFAPAYGIHGSRRRTRVDEVLALLDLEGHAGTPVSRLSGGWQRRVNAAIALVHEPNILVLDEPTAGLDMAARFELWGVIDTLRKTGAAVLLTTHQLDEAERLCSRLGILQNGRILREGSLEELQSEVPARQLAVVATDDEVAVTERALSLGWHCRRYGGQLTLLLPEESTLKAIVDQLDGIPMKSITLQTIGLDHIYYEVTGDVAPAG